VRYLQYKKELKQTKKKGVFALRLVFLVDGGVRRTDSLGTMPSRQWTLPLNVLQVCIVCLRVSFAQCLLLYIY